MPLKTGTLKYEKINQLLFNIYISIYPVLTHPYEEKEHEEQIEDEVDLLTWTVDPLDARFFFVSGSAKNEIK